jgi:hypothetical protein
VSSASASRVSGAADPKVGEYIFIDIFQANARRGSRLLVGTASGEGE